MDSRVTLVCPVLNPWEKNEQEPDGRSNHRTLTPSVKHYDGFGANKAGYSDLEPDPENFYWIRIRILSVLWLCKNVKTRENFFLNRAVTHFQVNFSIFYGKNNH